MTFSPLDAHLNLGPIREHACHQQLTGCRVLFCRVQIIAGYVYQICMKPPRVRQFICSPKNSPYGLLSREAEILPSSPDIKMHEKWLTDTVCLPQVNRQ